MTPMQDFPMPPWQCRAIFVRGVNDIEAGHERDVWIWFMARQGEDCWMAHGISSDCTFREAGAMGESLNDSAVAFDLDVLISYAGEPWAVIEPLPAQHAQMQRDMAEKLAASPSEMEKLRRLSRSEIEEQREREERAFMIRRRETT